MLSSTTISLRPVLSQEQKKANADSITFSAELYHKWAPGPFYDVPGVHMTHDGYVAAPCIACGAEVAWNLDNEEGKYVPALIDEDASCELGYVHCAGCF